METFNIDGAQGEGGGQILRTALSLSVLLQRPLHIQRIRAGRSKPGLMRQHLAAVKAAQAISMAEVEGAALGSTELRFAPVAVYPGHYHIDIGSAGSTTLVLQTLLPPLLRAGAESHITITGGTHNPQAPSTDFLQHCFLPQLRALGAKVQLDVLQRGLYPAGGGRILMHITPAPLTPLHLQERGTCLGMGAEALLASVPRHVGERELSTIEAAFPRLAGNGHVSELENTGPGNALSLWAHFEQVSELVTVHGARGISAETVAERACTALRRYLDSAAVVGPHLADQLLLPMWLAGGGSFRTMAPSGHLRTQAELINAMTGADIRLRAQGKLAEVLVRC